MFTEKSFFYTILGFTQSHSSELGDIERFVQLIPGSYKRDKPMNNKDIDKIHLKCDCIDGSMLNGTRESILYSFALDQRPGHKVYKQSRVKLFKEINNLISLMSRFIWKTTISKMLILIMKR